MSLKNEDVQLSKSKFWCPFFPGWVVLKFTQFPIKKKKNSKAKINEIFFLKEQGWFILSSEKHVFFAFLPFISTLTSKVKIF